MIEPSAALERPLSRQVLSQRHIPSLDGLRGIAILLVMGSHFGGSLTVLGLSGPGLTPFRLGWCGVDVFFALSGFLITGILLDTKQQANFFGNFYARRILRICPLYYGALLFAGLLRFAIPGDDAWGPTGDLLAPSSLLWPAVYLENYAMFLHGPSATGVMTHYWSLAVEEHFYFVWPLIVWWGSKRQLTWMAVLAIIASVGLRVAVYRSGADLSRFSALTPLRLDGLALGALASIWLRSPAKSRAIAGSAWLLLGLGSATLLGVIATRHTLSQFDPVMWSVGYTAVAIMSVGGILAGLSPGPLRHILSFSLLRWFGKYSFGLYVWHPILAVLMLHSRVALVAPGQTTGITLLVTGITICTTLIVAWLSFQLWERPFLLLKHYFRSAPAKTRLGELQAPATPSEPWARLRRSLQ